MPHSGINPPVTFGDSSLRRARSAALTVHRTVIHYRRLRFAYPWQGGLCRRKEERYTMKATGIVRRVDDLGRIVIPKEIRRTLKIREGDPSCTTLISSDLFIRGILAFGDRVLGSKH